MTNPSVSVIIPTFNRIERVSEAIRSVLTQKGVSFELLVVDDGSADGTKALVEQLIASNKHHAIRYLFQTNQGPASARNLGIQNAKGEFIAFLDSDDYWLPGKLARQISYFEAHPEFLICQTEEIWIRDGRRVNPMKKHQKFGGNIFEKCLPLCIVSPSCVMMRRTLFDTVGLFDPSFPACEDYELWLRMSARYQIGLVKEALVTRFGGHSDQRSQAFVVMDWFRIRALAKLIDSKSLSERQTELACRELKRKCEIVLKGAQKRGKVKVGAGFRPAPTTL
jgi:glycosyltransferase involved in cell wall biosynthesis